MESDIPDRELSVDERFMDLLPLARSRARAYEIRFSQQHGDLLTAAMYGAWTAAKTWDPGGGATLRSWGRRKIDGWIIDEFRRDAGSRHKHLRFRTVSLDEYLRWDRAGGQQRTLLDTEEFRDRKADDALQRIETLDLLHYLADRMPDREWRALSAHYIGDVPLKVIGGWFGVSESRVSQILSAACARARVVLRDGSARREDSAGCDMRREREWLTWLRTRPADER